MDKKKWEEFQEGFTQKSKEEREKEKMEREERWKKVKEWFGMGEKKENE